MRSPPPFAGEPHAVVVLPEADPSLGGHAPLLELERMEFEAELGTTVEIATRDPGVGARWLLVLDEDHEGPAAISFDPAALLVVSRARDVHGLFDSLSLFRTIVRAGGGTAEATECADLGAAIERTTEEVADTYPAFELRELDWPEICARHVPRVRAADAPLPALQEWLAELADGHTWAWPPFGNLPYAIRVGHDSAEFLRVPDSTIAFAEGVRPGWRLTSVDGVPMSAGRWLARAAAPAHARSLIAGRRILAGPVGAARTLTAVGPDRADVTWEEEPSVLPEGELVTWVRLGSGAGYVRIEAWVAEKGVDEALDTAFEELRRCDALVLDLRGNPGGNLVLACRTRARFLREPTVLGSIRYSIGGGRLSEPFPLTAEPVDRASRWLGRVVVLTDPLTFSASEDFLLGLAGLEHVLVVGERSGGGSGRPRSLALLPGITLTVSTALTYDREGRCVEGSGIPVDFEIRGTDAEVIAVAMNL